MSLPTLTDKQTKEHQLLTAEVSSCPPDKTADKLSGFECHYAFPAVLAVILVLKTNLSVFDQFNTVVADGHFVRTGLFCYQDDENATATVRTVKYS